MTSKKSFSIGDDNDLHRGPADPGKGAQGTAQLFFIAEQWIPLFTQKVPYDLESALIQRLFESGEEKDAFLYGRFGGM